MSQISLTFPDGNIRQYQAGVTPLEVAQSIAPSLAKAAISAQVDGKHWDLAWPIPGDAKLAINTLKDEADPARSGAHHGAGGAGNLAGRARHDRAGAGLWLVLRL